MEQRDNRFSTSDGIEYEVDKFGVIHQVDPQPYDYNKEYVDTYRTEAYRRDSAYLQGLRLGFVTACYNNIFRQKPIYMLDYGYGDGSYLELIKRSSKHCYGYDVTSEPLPQGVRQYDQSLKYDVISFWDVYEHINLDTLDTLETNMVVMSMPNVEGKDFETWKHRKPDEHIHHFTPKSLKLTMLAKGWNCIAETHIEDTIRKGAQNNIMTLAFVK